MIAAILTTLAPLGVALALTSAGTTAVDARPIPRDIMMAGPIEVPVRFHATVTAYSSSPDETDDTPEITASGRRVFDGLVACPRQFDFGTRFRIGRRIYTCWDRLHPRYDDRFDIWMESKAKALTFGRRRLVVEVLDSAS